MKKKVKEYGEKPMSENVSANVDTRTVLVGTYKGNQLTRWRGWYNYPISAEDKISEVDAAKVNELWLFNGTKAQKNYKAVFVGIKTRKELVEQYGYPAKGKAHGDKYLLFKTEFKYRFLAMPPDEADCVIVRTADFTTSPKVRKQLKAYLDSSDRNDPDLAKMLPSIITRLRPEQLRVCEAAVQLKFWDDVVTECFFADDKGRGHAGTVCALPSFAYVNSDALEFMGNIPSESVQLVLTSPPYNIGKEYEARTSIENYLEVMRPIVKQICRIISPNGSICWQVGNFVNNGEVYPLDIYFYEMFKKLGMQLRNRVIWHFGHGLHCKNRFSGRYETILWFTKTKDYVFNLDDVRVPSKYPGKRYYKGDKKGQLSGNPLGKNPEDVWTLQKIIDDWDSLIWDIPNVKSNHPEKVDHPCQFPVELVERCVLALSNVGDVVYDPFAGVGSTIIGALKNGRIGWGTELERKYVEIGQGRIAALARGELKLRPITQEIFAAENAGRLSKIPEEWEKKGRYNENR